MRQVKEMIYLYTKSNNNVTLREAIDQTQEYFLEAWGLLYSPQRCCFVKVNNGEIECHKDEDMNLKSVFEARIFNEQAELRWLNELNGKGRSVLLSDGVIDILTNVNSANLEVIDKRIQKYLLWGKGTGKDIGENWSRLATARIGKLNVPIPKVQSQQQVGLEVYEYFGITDCHGNVSVIEERLRKFKIIEGDQENGTC